MSRLIYFTLLSLFIGSTFVLTGCGGYPSETGPNDGAFSRGHSGSGH